MQDQRDTRTILTQSYARSRRLRPPISCHNEPELRDPVLMKYWTKLQVAFNKALRSKDDEAAIRVFDSSPEKLGRLAWPEDYTYCGTTPLYRYFEDALTENDRPAVLKHILLHPSGAVGYLSYIIRDLVKGRAWKSLEMMLRIGALDTGWDTVTEQDLQNGKKRPKPRPIIIHATGEACWGKDKRPAALALLLRWGTSVYEEGLRSPTGITWLDVACAQSAPPRLYGGPQILPIPQALYECKRGARPREVLGLLFDLLPPSQLAPVAFVDPRRGDQVVRWRRAVEAHRDAGMVFQAASEGRPMELAKRLRLGRLAGGLRARGVVGDVEMDALGAARAGGHGECVRVLVDRVKQE